MRVSLDFSAAEIARRRNAQMNRDFGNAESNEEVVLETKTMKVDPLSKKK